MSEAGGAARRRRCSIASIASSRWRRSRCAGSCRGGLRSSASTPTTPAAAVSSARSSAGFASAARSARGRARPDRRCREAGSAARWRWLADLEIRRRGWTVYPAAVARRLARDFPGALVGADIAFASDLPLAAGLSSSSALVVAIFAALSAINRLADRRRLPRQHQEPRRARRLSRMRRKRPRLQSAAGGRRSRDVRRQRGPYRDPRVGAGTPEAVRVLPGPIASGPCAARRLRVRDWRQRPSSPTRSVPRSPATTARRRRRARSSTCGDRLRARTRRRWPPPWPARPTAPIASGPCFAARAATRSPAGSRDRFEQFWLESEVIVPQPSTPLRAATSHGFGDLVDRLAGSGRVPARQSDARNDLPGRQARALGAFAASAFGAGFGGSVWALVPPRRRGGICRPLARRLSAGRMRRARGEFFVTAAGPPMVRL